MSNANLIWAPLPANTPNQAEWDKAAADFSTNRLVRVQGMAEKWAATVTSLIGIFSTVALIGGTDELGKIENDIFRWGVILATIAAGGVAVYAAYEASQAAQGPLPTLSSNYTTDTYRDWVNARTVEAAAHLGKARAAGLWAVGLVAAVAVAALVNTALPATATPTSTAVVVSNDGATVCGKLSTDESGKLRVNDRDVGSVKSVVPVDKC